VGLDPSAPNGGPATDGVEAAPAALATALPKIAEKADDLEAIKKAVDDAAAVSGGLWLSYLFVLFYFAIAAGAVTHKDLFFENPVKLPFLSVELPLFWFFLLAPILFLVVHAYTLLHLVFLTDKAKRFHQELRKQIGEKDGLSQDELKKRKDVRDGLRRQLPSNIFVQFLAGAPETRGGLFGWALRAIGWTTLVVGPVLLLLMMQIQFLPYHSLFITWSHRLALLADLILLWWLWRRILSGRDMDGRQRVFTDRLWTTLGGALFFGAILFSGAMATFPGEHHQEFLTKWDTSGLAIYLHEFAFGDPDSIKRLGSRKSVFSSTLNLAGLNIYEELKIDDPQRVKWRDYIFRARGRDLKGATFDLATLPKVDFNGSQLQGASFLQAQLQDTSFDGAQLQGVWLDGAELQGASLTSAQLQGAALKAAQLQNATLWFAQLQGAWLDGAHLQGSSLDSAQLQGASLNNTQLQGALLHQAQLQGASLDLAWTTSWPHKSFRYEISYSSNPGVELPHQP